MSLSFDLELPRRDFLLRLSGSFETKTVGIFGRSGAGKTSFFQMLCGLLRPSEGRVVLNGRILTDSAKHIHLPPHKRRIGVVFQDKLLFPHLNIRENLLFGSRYSKKTDLSYDDVVELLALGNLLDSMPCSVSGGEQQRAAIGRALLSGPDLLLLDEPLSAVDADLKKTILPYIKRVRDELDIPMLVISHDLEDIQALTDRIYLIEEGRNTGYGSVYDLIENCEGFAKNARLTNIFELTCAEKSPNGLYSCRVCGIPGCSVKLPKVNSGDSFLAGLHPSDISVSLHRISGISIQNQLPGVVRKIIKVNGSVYCMVDVGRLLITKITSDAIRDMNLKPGDRVFCLFKATSLHI